LARRIYTGINQKEEEKREERKDGGNVGNLHLHGSGKKNEKGKTCGR